MNNYLEKIRKKKALKLFNESKGDWKNIDLETREHPSWMTRCFRNNRYIVMINDNAITDKGTAIRAMIQKHDDTPISNHWSQMQQIKNDLFGTETTAVEYYPKESHLQNQHNIYWMWIFPEGVLPIPV